MRHFPVTSFALAPWAAVSALTLLGSPAVAQTGGSGEIVEEFTDTAYLDRNEQVMKELREEAAKSGGTVPAPTPEYREVVEDRAFVMVFGRSGDEFQPENDPISFVSERWEILGEPKVIRVLASKV